VPAAGGFKLTLLDVGQGLSVAIRTHAHTLVYDAGPVFRTGRDTGELVVLPYLRSQGIRRVDLLMISHGDLDHSGGMRSIVGGIPVTTLRVGPSVKAAGLLTQQCRRGQRWRWDEVEFEVLHPINGAYVRDNDSSCVLRVSGAGGSVLLTGDIQRDAEAALTAAGLANVDVVVVPHHGSRTSSTQAFIDATRPRLALFGTGYRNRWAFPKQDVVERWKDAGALPLASADTGAVEVTVDVTGVQAPRLHRRTARRYWRAR
jgi:competence protein ComEC